MPPLRPYPIELFPSARLSKLLAMQFTASAIVVAALPLPLLLKVTAFLLLLGGWWRLRPNWGGHWLLAPQGEGEWRVVGPGGRCLTCTVDGSSLVLPGLVLLHLRPRGREWRLPMVLPVVDDRLPAHEFRRLRVWLRFSGSAGE